MARVEESRQVHDLDSAAREAGLEPIAVVFIGHDLPQRSALIVDAIALDAVRAFARSGRRLAKLDLAAPWLLTPGVLASSRDTFPLEVLELRHAGRVLAGALDLEAEPDAEHVRLQIERELKAAAIQLRQQLLTGGGGQPALDASLPPARIALARVARGIAWLAERAAAADPTRWQAVAPEGPQRELVVALQAGHAGWEAYAELYAAVVAAAEAVDAHG